MPMVIRDADLRQAVVDYGTRPGGDLWGLLVELQRLRDAQSEESRAESRPGTANGRSQGSEGGHHPRVP